MQSYFHNKFILMNKITDMKIKKRMFPVVNKYLFNEKDFFRAPQKRPKIKHCLQKSKSFIMLKKRGDLLGGKGCSSARDY